MENDYYRLLHDFEQTYFIKFNRNTFLLKLNSLSHKVLNLHIFPLRKKNSAYSNISFGTSQEAI